MNFDSVAPINWDGACDDPEDGFLVYCYRMRYVKQAEEAPTQDEEEGDTQKRTRPKDEVRGDGGKAHRLRPKNQSPVLIAVPWSLVPKPQQDPGPSGQ